MAMSELAGIKSRAGGGRPSQVTRHHAVDRAFHWLMAAAVLVLVATAFLPILGLKFQWVDIHWVTGVLLVLLVVFHIVRAMIWQDWRNMMIGPADVREIWRDFCGIVGGARLAARSGKYDALQKLYHLAIAVLVLCTVGSGVLMLLKIDTPLWRRDPYWFSSDAWGVIYAVHGFAAMALVTMVMIHIYFALRPDEWHLTRSMIRGWITGEEYNQHYDSERWKT